MKIKLIGTGIKLGIEDRNPDGATLWLFREKLVKAGLIETLFDRFGRHLDAKGYIARGGQMVDAPIARVPKQRYTYEENEGIKPGQPPEDWARKPASYSSGIVTWLSEYASFRIGEASASANSRLRQLLIAAPALIVPAIVTFIIFWARHKFYQQSPSAFDAGSPTISQSISEPNIAIIFATVVSLAAVLLAQVVWRIIKLYYSTINTAIQDNARWNMASKGVLAAAAIGQFCSVAGILLLSWVSESTLHISGSYLFFFGQASAILFSGILCFMLIKTPAYDYARGWPENRLCPKLSGWRSRIAPGIVAAAGVFWLLFLFRESFDHHSPYWLDVSFSTLEFGLIISFLLYLATFFSELYRSQNAEESEA